MAKYKIIKSGIFGSYPAGGKNFYNDYEAFITKYGNFNNIKDIRIKNIYLNYDGVRMRGMNLTYQITKLDNSVENFEGVNNHEGGGGSYDNVIVPDGDRIKKIKGGCGGWIDWVSFEFEKQATSKSYGVAGGGQPFELENPLLYFTQLNWTSKDRGIGFYTYNPDIKEVNQQEADLKTANAEIENKKEVIKKRDSYIVELEKERDQLKTDKTQLDKDKKQAETDRDQAKTDLTKTQGDLTTANNKISTLEADKQQLIKDKATAESERDSVKGDLNIANSKITQLEGDKIALNNTITNLNTQIASKDTTINDLNGTIKDKDIIIDKLRPLEAKITALEEQLKSKDGELTKRNDSITILTNEKTKAEGERDQWKEAVNKSNTLIAEKDQQITNLTTEKNTAETKLKEKDGEIAKLNQQLTQQGNQPPPLPPTQGNQYLNKLIDLYKKEIKKRTELFYQDLGLDESDEIRPEYEGANYLTLLGSVNGDSEPDQVINAFKIVSLVAASKRAKKWSDEMDTRPNFPAGLKKNRIVWFKKLLDNWNLITETPKKENNPLYISLIDNLTELKQTYKTILAKWQSA